MAESGSSRIGYSGDRGGSARTREQDHLLPIANIDRIMRKAIPQNVKISKDAKLSMQECASEFICFVTSEATNKCQREKRKTINGDDLVWAMATLGFDEYVKPLRLYLQLYGEIDEERTGYIFSDAGMIFVVKELDDQ